jgi:hypothetical protein
MTSSKAWRSHDEVEPEVIATVAWYENERPELGFEFLSELRRTLGVLRAAPGISTKDPDAPAEARVRRRRLDRFPFAVIFAESETAQVRRGIAGSGRCVRGGARHAAPGAARAHRAAAARERDEQLVAARVAVSTHEPVGEDAAD